MPARFGLSLAFLVLVLLSCVAGAEARGAEHSAVGMPGSGGEHQPAALGPAVSRDEGGIFFSAYYAGALALDRRQYAEAARALRYAIVLRPDFAEAYCELGIAELGLQHPQRAIAALKQSLVLKPSFASRYMAVFSLGEAYQLVGMPRRAAAAYTSALRLHGNLAVAYKRLARLQLRYRQQDRAIAAYWSYVAFAPNAPDTANITQRVRRLREQARRRSE